MDWSEKNLCIKCNGGGNLLVCSETGCPLAIHEGCMGCPARFDDVGRFYCPYCLYKQAVAESRQAREYALARKKALLTFMDEDMIGREKRSGENERAEANGHNQSKVSEPNVNITACGDDKSRRNSDSVLNQSIHLDEEHKISDADEENVQEEETGASEGSKGQDPSLQMPEEQKISNEEETKTHNEKHEASGDSSSQDPSRKMLKHERIAEEEKILEEERETSSASSGQDTLPLRERTKRVLKRRKSTRRNSDAVSVKNNLVERSGKNKQSSPTVNSPRRSSRRSSSAMRTDEVIKEKVEVSRKLKNPELSSVKIANDAFGSGKRKRLLWSEKEEETLKAGVEKYSKESIKNLPWRKILEDGHRVFDKTRSPSDLKDKWRNMSTK